MSLPTPPSKNNPLLPDRTKPLPGSQPPPAPLPPPRDKTPYSALPGLPEDGILRCRPGQIRTVQAGAEALDINNIVTQAFKTGTIPTLNYRAPQFGDATKVPNLQQALQMRADQVQLYRALPEQVRKETNNDPRNLPAWLADPRNQETARKLGLLKPKETPPPPAKPMPVVLVDPKNTPPQAVPPPVTP